MARLPILPLHRLFELQAEKTPERIALVYADQRLTYAELNRHANRVAHRLRAMGVGPEVMVGLAAERSLELVIGVLGILKAGGAYVPLDPDYPEDRLQAMLEDCQASVLVMKNHESDESTTLSLGTRAGVRMLDLRSCLSADSDLASESGENPSLSVTDENLAYIIYTSGSTGRPKGALTQHGNVVRLFNSADSLYGFGENDVWTLFHSYAFDFSVWEIWGPLLYGGTLVVVPYCVSRAPRDFYALLSSERVTVLNQTPSAFFSLMRVDEEIRANLALRYVILGGEALSFPALRPWFDRHGYEQPRLVNGYGPTETTIFATFKFVAREDLQGQTVSNLGNWLPDLSITLVDEKLQRVPTGASGEILIGGAGLSRGYLNRPELTAEKFIANPFDTVPGKRLYRSGDLGRLLPNGELEYLGRIDHQVKLRGFRIELGEIEAVLRTHAEVREAAVSLREDEPGEKYLAAYVVSQSARAANMGSLRAHLAKQLPEYMIPSTFTEIGVLPLSPHGKLDRNALPKPEQKRPELEQTYVAPRSVIEKKIASVWLSLLRMDRVGIDDSFFELGGNSLLSNQAVARLSQEHGIEIPIVKFFEYPNIRSLSKHIAENGGAKQAVLPAAETDRQPKSASVSASKSPSKPFGVAIIGMAARFPGAANVDEFWENLVQGTESTRFFQEHELDLSVSLEDRKDPNYVPARGVIEGADRFDAAFFGINPQEAQVMDPQHRIFLETSWEALENSGYGPGSQAALKAGAIGVYAGTYNNTYYSSNVIARPDLIAQAGAFQTMLASEKDYVAPRVAYKLGLMGPSVSLYTACSTSLVAVSQAYFALLTGQCDMALAGGASITVPQNTGHIYQEGSMLSSDGHCRPFDARASGTVFSDGVGAVVLKRVEDAIRDGDTIYGVIRGAAINNDGAERMSFTAPSVNAQAKVIAAALKRADVHPETISYVEAHGTATPLGDPIEVEALTQAYRLQTSKTQFCGLGSVKSNFGHLTIAAGVAGLIKTALSLKHELIPASLHFEKPNPKIDFVRSPFRVNAQATPWPKNSATPRRAGVSAFGVGGTNAHVIIEEAPAPGFASKRSRPRQLLLLSAKTPQALDKMTENLRDSLSKSDAPNLADAAFTLQTGRKSFPHRRAFVCDSSSILKAFEPVNRQTRTLESPDPELVFMFPGQGSQYVDMGKNLYDSEPVFKETVDRCAEILRPLLKRDLREVLYPRASDSGSAEELLKATFFTQPALFTIEYALACLWASWGVRPDAMIGHSVGEFVCACLSGVFSLEDALKLVAERGRLMQGLPGGSMLSVRQSAEKIIPLLDAETSIASVNSPTLCVVAGTHGSVAALKARLETDGVACRPLHTSHAFHSAMMDPIIDPFLLLVKEAKLSAPSIPFVSTVTGDWITRGQATDPAYWARHLRETVRFSDAVQRIWKEQPGRILLEVGPRSTLATLARQHAQDLKKQVSIPSMGETAEDGAEWTALLKAMGALWSSGVTLDWDGFYAREKRRRVPLPGYSFEKKRFWVDPVRSTQPVQIQKDPSPPIPAKIPEGVHAMSIQNDSRQARAIPLVKKVLEDTSGMDLNEFGPDTTFLEMGMDSLFLTQVATALGKKFSVKISFRQLLEEYTNLGLLSEFIARTLPEESLPIQAPAQAPVATAPSSSPAVPLIQQHLPLSAPSQLGGAPLSGGMESLLSQQLQLMARQLEIMSGGAALMPLRQPQPTQQTSSPTITQSAPSKSAPKSTSEETPKPFGAAARISLNKGDSMDAKQSEALAALSRRYISRTKESKRLAQANRAHLADPRVVSGFRPILKEVVYPIHVNRSSGSRLWDVDGNEYVDLSCGFGTNFFGNVPSFITDAIKSQLDHGMEIGPQHPLAGEVAQMFREMTKTERVAFCSTGSEALLGAMRLARTATGRSTIAIFTGSYHGIFDEVIVRGSKTLRTTPAAPGIMPEAVQNVLVLDYGTPETLEILRKKARDGELAAILCETVQSRNPDLQPRDFLLELRKLTEETETALIFDEVITGFRCAPGGIQEYFGIQCDIATYGKVIGGGLPMGVIAGKKKWMDGLDGGFWSFGDASTPEAGVTYFAGTYVRHPLALASAKAVLTRLKAEGPDLQKRLNARTTQLVNEMNAWFKSVGAPIHFAHFSSLFKVAYTQDLPYGELLYTIMREKGVHIWDARPCFLTLAHSEADIARITSVFKEAVAEMQSSGFMPGKATETETAAASVTASPGLTFQTPPIPGARLGRDPSGNPAWFIADPKRPGKYLQLGSENIAG